MTVTPQSRESLRTLAAALRTDEDRLRQGGDAAGHERQRRLGRLTARERLALLVDAATPFVEIGLWAGYGMYLEWDDLPAAGVVAGIGTVSGRHCMLVANDATVKAGAMFPASIKKVLRAQRLAYQCRLPLLYLVDSSGVFLPLQDEVFPDEDDFGRIFRNNAVLSSLGIPQFAAIMGNCIAGGAYLPVLCDQLLMTRGSGLYLAGPSLVKAAIGQVIDTETLGGADMHASISGTVDFLEEDDASCLSRLRDLAALLPADPATSTATPSRDPARSPETLYDLVDGGQYDVRDLLDAIVDADSAHEYKSRYGQTLVTLFARIGGHDVGIVANQRHPIHNAHGAIEIGGVIYNESADKAARFVMTCNQLRLPLVFFQDVAGFMVGRDSEQSGIIRSGAKLVNAISNSVVPKLTVIVGNSFGAGHYALCGKAYDPLFLAAWPNAHYAVMGADQAAETLLHAKLQAAARQGSPLDVQAQQSLRESIRARYLPQMDIRYAAARGWVDALIIPEETRSLLVTMLYLAKRSPLAAQPRFCTGVLQT